MIKEYNYGGVAWKDLECPTTEEISKIVQEYNLNPTTGEELLEPSLKPRTEFFDDYTLIVLKFPARKHLKGKYFIVEKEIDFIIGKSFVITTRYDTVEPIHNVAKIIETNSALDSRNEKKETPAEIFYYMLKALYQKIEIDLDGIRSELHHIESRIFEGREKEMVEKLSYAGREIIDINQIIITHSEPLERMRLGNENHWEHNFKRRIDDLIFRYKKISTYADNNRDLQIGLRSTNDSLLSNKQSDIMKTFTILAFMTFPLSLFVGILGLDTNHRIIIGYRFDFEIILGIVVISVLVMIIFFKKKKWI
jgi:magnesium transporter